MMLCISVDFPLPVVPAINRCGHFVRSSTYRLPSLSTPRLRGINILGSGSPNVSRQSTWVRCALGTLTPITASPGNLRTKTSSTASVRAKSCAQLVICDTLDADFGANRYVVIRGPVVMGSTKLTSRPSCASFTVIAAIILNCSSFGISPLISFETCSFLYSHTQLRGMGSHALPQRFLATCDDFLGLGTLREE